MPEELLLKQPLSPQLLIAGAHVLVGLGRRTGTAGESLVDDMRREAHLTPGAPWDLAFVHHVGWHTHRRMGHRSGWPFPREANHDDVARMAREQRAIVDRPVEGDVVLYWSTAAGRHTRAGIVVELHSEWPDSGGGTTFDCRTVEVGPVIDGQAPAPSGDGWVREQETPICPGRGDLFIRWTMCDARQAALDSRPRVLAPPVVAGAYDEQLRRCA